MMEKEPVFNKIPHKVIETDIEKIDLYQLGIFENSAFTLVELNKDQYYPLHIHHKSKSKIHIIFGEGKIILNNKQKDYRKGDIFAIGKGISHGFKVKTRTLFLSIETPPIIKPDTEEVDIEYIDSGKKGGKLY